MSMSVQSSQSSSSSVPVVTETPENQIIDQISQYAQSLAGQMYSWAQGVYAQTSQITNQAVGNFFNVSQQMSGLSNNLTGQYNNLFAPENAQLVAEANSYASPSRMAVDMGQAGATQAQAGEQALANSEAGLRSFGIDPSSGRYAALDKAAAVQNAANVAGAENTQRNADIATGQRLRSEAVQVGATLPAAISNVNNTGIQANTGAVNSTLANANTGANLNSLPDKYLGTAMNVKLPLQGQNSQSHGSGMGSSSSPSPQRPSSGGGGNPNPGGNPAGGNPSGPAWGMNNPAYGGPPGIQTGPDAPQLPPLGPEQWPPQPPPGPEQQPWDTGTGTIGPQTTDPVTGGDLGTGGLMNNFGQDWGNGNTFPGGDVGTWGGGSTGNFGGSTSMGGGADPNGLGAFGWDPNQNQSLAGTGGSGWNDPPPQTNTDPTIWGGSGGNSPDYSQMPTDSGPAVDTSYGSGGYDPSSYAAGGPVPSSMSPSGGQQVDDIQGTGPQGRVNLNANEFVIPQDVALWKGQEFFQNLIDQSRKKRVTAPARPTQAMPAQNMR